MKTLALVPILCSVGGAAWLVASPERSEIAGYRSWKKVNAEPHQVFSALAVQCRMVTAADLAREKAQANPHTDYPKDKFVTVYVNGLGEKPMLRQKNPNFPVGTIIVKEKLPTPESTSPELLTVMIKRQKGYNPKVGDWEFMVCDGDGKKIQARGKLANCQSCHIGWKATGFVTRTYLSESQLRKLK